MMIATLRENTRATRKLMHLCCWCLILLSAWCTAGEEDLIKLESTFIGDKEQPAVSYFIPWKGTSTPDKLYWNMDEKYDQTLQIIDRDVMLRSINFYDEMNLEEPTALE